MKSITLLAIVVALLQVTLAFRVSTQLEQDMTVNQYCDQGNPSKYNCAYWQQPEIVNYCNSQDPDGTRCWNYDWAFVGVCCYHCFNQCRP